MFCSGTSNELKQTYIYIKKKKKYQLHSESLSKARDAEKLIKLEKSKFAALILMMTLTSRELRQSICASALLM